MKNRISHYPDFVSLVREAAAIPAILAGGLRAAEKIPRSGAAIPIIVIPGMLSTDGATSLLRRSLEWSGYVVYGWGLGFNTGVQPEKLEALTLRIGEIARKHQQKPVLIGWSLGGLYARALGSRCGDEVGMVITLGTPFSGDRRANHAWRLYELINRHSVDNPPVLDDPSIKPPVQTIAIWARGDGVVDPSCARGLADESDEQIAFDATHLQLGVARGPIRKLIHLLNERTAHLS